MQYPNQFSLRTKNLLALRADNRCSFPGCSQVTKGPSSESPSGTTNIGEAAHICAASPGGKRYDPSMSPQQRSDITNGIWLCVNHARLIDRDEAEYSVDSLRAMKQKHEDAVSAKVRGTVVQWDEPDLIALGPDIVVLGQLTAMSVAEWTLQIDEFVSGDLKQLADFIDGFASRPLDRYVLVNALGDGRVLADPPRLRKNPGGIEIHCPVAPRFTRERAQNLGSQMASHPDTNDVYLSPKGNIARVSGVESLPQVIRQSLSLKCGESPFHPEFGTRLGEYVDELRDSPWLGKLIKLEVIRQAAIPYHDPLATRAFTPLHCIERVWNVEVLSDTIVNKRLLMHMDFDVKGVGRWQCELLIFVEFTKAHPPRA